MNRWRRFFSWCCLIVGGVQLCVLSVGVIVSIPERKQVPISMLVLIMLSGITALVGWTSLKKYKVDEVAAGKARTYGTKNCPGCKERIPLRAEICPECGKKQKANDSTCSGGANTATQAKSGFVEKRGKAKKARSPGYIWRTARDGAVCERCAANEGLKFSWAKEPPGGHAGAKARCRCYPEPIEPRD